MIPADAMSNRLNDAMSKLNVDNSRNSLGRPPPSPGAKRNSGLDSSTINAMFPDAAAAIARRRPSSPSRLVMLLRRTVTALFLGTVRRLLRLRSPPLTTMRAWANRPLLPGPSVAALTSRLLLAPNPHLASSPWGNSVSRPLLLACDLPYPPPRLPRFLPLTSRRLCYHLTMSEMRAGLP